MPGTGDKTVRVRLIADTQPYAKGMSQASGATTKLGKDMDGIGAKSKAMEANLGKASGAIKGLAVAGGALAGAAVASFLSDSVKAAGDLQQSLGGVDAVFKDTADVVHKFGETSAESVGLSTNAFNELVTVTGALLKNKGIDDFTQKSLDLVKIGADLSATYGGTAKDAVEALNAAMRGESDPIERYGISLNETAVNAEIAAKGMDKLTGAALDQAKAQARIDIVTRQSADALGKFASEADTLQGQQQRLSAQWENAKAQLGSALLPALTDVVKMLRQGVDVAVAAAGAFEAIPGPVKAAVLALVALHLAGKPVGNAFGAIRDSARRLREEMVLQQALATGIQGGYRKLGDEVATASTKMGKGAAAMAVATNAARTAGSGLLAMLGGPWGLAITGATVAITGWIQAQQDAKRAADEFAATLDKTTGKFTDQSRELAQQKFFKDFAQQDYSKVADSLSAAGVGLEDLIVSMDKGPGAVKEWQSAFDKWRASNEATFLDAGVNVEALGNSFAALIRDQKAAAEVAGVNRKTTDRLAESTKTLDQNTQAASMSEETRQQILKDTADAQKKATDEVKKAAQAILDLHDAQLAASDANIGYQQSIADATDRLSKFGELQKQLEKAGGVSDRTKKLQDKLSSTTDAKKRKAIEKDLAESRAKDAQKQTEEQAKLREEQAKYARTLDLTTEAGRANQKALNGIATSAREAAKQNLEAGASQASVNKQMDDARAKFIQTAQGFGATKTAAAQMADQYGLTRTEAEKTSEAIKGVPVTKTVTVNARTEQARANVADLKEQLAGVTSKTVTITAKINLAGITETRRTVDDLRSQLGLGGKGFAKGTPSAPPGMAWVGEQGPELLQFRGGERVFTASQSAAIARSLVRWSPPVAPAGPASISETTHAPINIAQVVGNVAEIEREAEQRRRLASLSSGRRRRS